MKVTIKKRLFLIIFLLSVILAGWIWQSKTASLKTSPSVSIAKVKKIDFLKIVSSSGKTSANKSVKLKFQTSGKLTWVGVKEGDFVYAYQAIASLDRRDVQKTLEKTLRDYSTQRNNFDEMTKITYGEKKTTDVNDTIKRILEKNQWDLEKSVLDVELKNLALEYSTLVSPIAGIVTHIDTPVAGVNITPAAAEFEIIDPASILFEANIDEVDVGGLLVGQRATINLDAYADRTFEGTVSAIAFNAKTSAGGATVFPVKISFGNSDVIRVGLNGDVTIETEKSPQSLVIPLTAIKEDESGKFVYKKTGSTFQKKRVTIGIKSDDEVVILEGLTELDEVAIKGFTNIKTSTP